MSALPKKLRELVLERDNWTCRYCTACPDPMYEWHEWARRWMCNMHVDHIWPRCLGGSNDLDNLAAACVDCNLAKYDKFWVPLDWDV